MAKRGSEHGKAQRAGRQRDFETCQVCGSKERAEGHHIMDYQFGGAASIDNIVTLCQKCHKEVHNGKIDILKF